MLKLRDATVDDTSRVIEMAVRFLLETQYGELFDNATTPDAIGRLISAVLNFGVIIVAEKVENPEQDRYLAELEAIPDATARAHRVMQMSTTQKAILNWGDDYGPTKAKRTLVGMLAIVMVPHPLSGKTFAEEIAWWVEPEHRKGLIGPKMLRLAEEWATRNGANMVKMVAPAATSVGMFYERSGYKAVETAYIKTI